MFAAKERIGFEWHIVDEKERKGEYEISIHLNDDEAKGEREGEQAEKGGEEREEEILNFAKHDQHLFSYSRFLFLLLLNSIGIEKEKKVINRR